MKIAKLTLMFLACAAAIPAFAQNTTDSRCGTTNYDSSRNMFTITKPTPGTPNQQCFINVVPKQSWTGGPPNLTSSQLVEGNYTIEVAGGNGGGGGSGGPGANAAPLVTTGYLSPGVYRLTIGGGGQGGDANGGNGANGAPTSLSNAYSGETVAGFPRAESWNGTYPGSYNVASSQRVSGQSPPGCSCGAGAAGGSGFIKMALNDPVPQAAPVQAAPPPMLPPPAAPIRPARRDRN